MADERHQDATEAVRADERRQLAHAIATKELPRVRQRGLRNLDTTSKPVACPLLDDLAQRYADTIGKQFGDRPALLTYFMEQMLNDYEREHVSGAVFIRRLFFSPPDTVRPLSPGELLALTKEASDLSGYTEASRFDRLRRKEFASFAAFMVGRSQTPLTDERSGETAKQASSKRRARFSVQAAIGILVVGVGMLSAYRGTLEEEPRVYRIAAKNVEPKRWANDLALPLWAESPKVGEAFYAKCRHTIKQPDGTAVYWLNIKAPRHWAGTWVPATSFVHGTELAKRETECVIKD
ncbi:hypothetical protein [Streptomyces chartreusis]|uniref:Uncharacterized protein n=1 Tax=Streptomyces chartreusis TaxID=1969 RepID=A0A7H8TLB7_STRCX|nr:hypothetical protein [Streptomyces chartreusis]QKZ22860.1 hypothetical protein HUT05_39245 [Streptomyces chartreusis]